MKFGKVIQRIGEELPDRQFLRYKELKKLLKHIKATEGKTEECAETTAAESDGKKVEKVEEQGDARESSTSKLSAEETEFIKALNEELFGLNNYYMDAEEKVVIRLQALEAQLCHVQETKNQDLLQSMKAALIDFHAVTKILKKHDKQTGVLLRAPYLEAVLRQPFYSTDLLGKLAKRVASIVEQLVDPTRSPEAPKVSASLLQGFTSEGSSMSEKVRMTQMALGTWRELGDNASTPSTVLPSKLKDHPGVVTEGHLPRPNEEYSVAKTDVRTRDDESHATRKRKHDDGAHGDDTCLEQQVSKRKR